MNIFLKRIYAYILNVFYPKFCITCSKEGEFLCSKCIESVHTYPTKIFKPFIPVSPLLNLYIPCSYHNNPVLQKAVHLMKYTFYKDLSVYLAKLLIKAINEAPLPRNTHLIPIPLHKKRLKYRGFNQSELLANQISKRQNYPSINLLKRIKETKTQAELSREERLKNVENIFAINGDFQLPKDTPLLIIDDICTTLSTMNEAAITLQKHGYKIIFGAAIARA